MHVRKATAGWPRPPKLPRVNPPRLHQPTIHLTVMVGAAAIVTALATATPSLQGSFVGTRTAARPVSVVADGQTAAAAGKNQPVYGAPTSTTSVAPPPHTIVGPGAGRIATVLFSDPNGKLQIGSPLASDGIPVTALEAYQDAANAENAADPGCHIPWPLLAGIGRVESDHGRYGGAVLRPDGTSTKPIIGIPLNGNGTEVVSDTDHGTIDGDPVYDRAVGPMQFIPSTWLIYGADGNGDGIKDPFNIFDAAAAAAHYLCVAGGDLSTTAGQTRAVLTYNHSTAYLNEVLGLEHTYASGDPGLIIPSAPTVVPPVPAQGPGGQPVPPPADPGPPLAGGSPDKDGAGSTSAGSTRHHPGSGGGSSSGGKPGNGSPTPPPTDSSSTGTGPGDPGSSGSGSPTDTGSPGSPGSPGSSDTSSSAGTPGDSSSAGNPSGSDTSSAGGPGTPSDSSASAPSCPTPSSSGTSTDAASGSSTGTAGAAADPNATANADPAGGGAGAATASATSTAVAAC